MSELLDPLAALDVLTSAGVPFVRTATAPDPAAARACADGLGYPVVLKAGGLNHKTESAGVIVGLRDGAAVEQAARDLCDRLGAQALPLVLQQQAAGLELLVGVRRVPGLGASVVVGMGGTLAELHADVASRMAPVDAAGAERMLRELRSWPLLEGYRGAAPHDVAAACELVAAVSRLTQARPDVVELDLNPVFVGKRGGGAVGADVRIAVERDAAASAAEVAPAADRPELSRLLAPQSVAVVGVSDTPGSVGAKVFANLLAGGFAGRLIPVHPAGGTYDGHARARSVAEIEPAPDLVCVAVRAEHVPAIAREAAAAGCGGAVVFSAGFAEAGTEGAALQRELTEIAAQTPGFAVVGPNTLGVLSLGDELLASFAGMLRRGDAPAGETAILTSSGALGSCLASRLWSDGVGLSRWVSLGNEADLGLADFARWLADDERTRLVGAIVDHLGDGPALVEAVGRLRAHGKPLLACLLARTDSGSAASQSHTGAMVGSHRLRRDVLDAAGAVVVDGLQELEDALALAARQPLPRGSRVGVVTASGGACTIVADEVEATGLELPSLPDALRDALAEALPAFATFANPLDITATITSDPAGFAAALRAFAESDAFDAILVQFTTNADPIATATAREVVAAIDGDGPPVYVARYGSAELAPQAMEVYREHGVSVLDTPQRLVRAVDALVRCGVAVRAAAEEALR